MNYFDCGQKDIRLLLDRQIFRRQLLGVPQASQRAHQGRQILDRIPLPSGKPMSNLHCHTVVAEGPLDTQNHWGAVEP